MAANAITTEKLAQAQALVAGSGVDVWMVFVRESAVGGDPVLPLILDGGLTWQSALLLSADGTRIAVVGNYDAEPLKATGEWPTVVPYVDDIRDPLVEALESLIGDDVQSPKIAVDYSRSDVMADGLSHGMWQLLCGYLEGTRFAEALVSAEAIAGPLRARKTGTELQRIREAIQTTNDLFDEIGRVARVGMTERAVYEHVQQRMDAQGLGYSWDRAGDPIVNSGPDSMIGHGRASDAVTIEPGHVFHVDLGVQQSGYCSDIQRCWYVPRSGEDVPPEDVHRATDAVNAAISAGAAAMRPGAVGWRVDQAAREALTAAGYPEYMHALGHQVGRMAHDGGTILGPRWPRYGTTPLGQLAEGEVYTVELGVIVEGRGYLGIEEMVRVGATGIDWLTERQLELPLLEAQT